jgi:hypothetical protein
MATAVVFDLVTALVNTCATALPGVSVYDGQGASDDPGNFLMIGVEDPDDPGPAEAASGSLEWAGLGHRASKENGSIACVALAWSGNTGNAAQQAVREAVRDMVGTVETTLRNDPNLGGTVPGLNWVRYAGNFRLRQISAADGVAAVFRFDVAYIASL